MLLHGKAYHKPPPSANIKNTNRMEGKKTSSSLVTQSASFMASAGVPLDKFRNLRIDGFVTS